MGTDAGACVCKTSVSDTSDLKQRLIDTWVSIPQDVVDTAVDQWRTRLGADKNAKCCHFQHLLQPTGAFQSHPQFPEENALCLFCTPTFLGPKSCGMWTYTNS